MREMNRSAALLGVSELIGAEYPKILLAEDSFDKVHAPVRTPPGLDRPKPVQRTVLVDELEATSVARASLGAPRQAVSNNAGAFLMSSQLGRMVSLAPSTTASKKKQSGTTRMWNPSTWSASAPRSS